MPKYIVTKGTVINGGIRYKTGDEVTLTEKQAKNLSKLVEVEKKTNVKKEDKQVEDKQVEEQQNKINQMKEQVEEVIEGSG